MVDVNYKFHYTKFGFKRVKSAFLEHIQPKFIDVPTSYLEIGVFEGYSMSWMLERVLTHPDSKAVGIDPWLPTLKLQDMESVYKRAHANLCRWLYHPTPKCELVRANSSEILRRVLRGDRYLADRKLSHYGLRPCSVDLCYIDGAHHALGVWDDARLVYQLMKPGGWMLFDDVRNQGADNRRDHVKQGLQMFLTEVGEGVQLAWEHRYMECYEKALA